MLDLSKAVVMVCGGAGFIGSHFARLILKNHPGAKVVIFDALTYAGNLSTIQDILGDRATFVHGKIQDMAAVDAAIKANGITHIVNFAAESHNDRSILDPGSFIHTDVFGVFVLCEATKKFGLEKYVQVSTDEVYGSINEGRFTEESPIMPNTPYSSSKAGGDLQARAHHITFGTPVCVTRGGNNYGPYQYPEKLISFFAVRLILGKKVPLYGDGTQVREWIHVQDHCRGIEAVLLKGEPGGVYNVGDENERQNKEIVRILLEETGQGEELVKRIEDPRKGAHDKRYSMTSNRTRALGWQPEMDFETEVRNTVRWYRDNKDWWEPIVAMPDYQSFVKSFYGRYLGDDL
ncbi:MAG: dTDP-glucose 4,6-dehydratase [Armatimonadetes bacterium]|nr:dTDP-glucose 4,6-dehydratase [Armatimonadota bacterium]